MFYVGWVEGGKNRFQNYLGLAIRENNEKSFRRVSRAPIIDRSNEEPFGIGSCCVVKDEDRTMLYTSFGIKTRINLRLILMATSYNIKTATSNDLIYWKRSNKAILEFKEENTYMAK